MKSELKNRFKEIYGGFIVDIMKCTKLTPLRRIILNYLCNNKDSFSPSYGKIAENCGTDRKSAIEAIKAFEVLNLLCIEKPGNRARNIIHLHYDVIIIFVTTPKLTSGLRPPAKLTSGLRPPGVVGSDHQGGGLRPPVLLDSKNRQEIDKKIDKTPPTPLLCHLTSHPTDNTPKSVSPPGRGKSPTKKPLRQFLYDLAVIWYTKTPPTEKHVKETVLAQWASFFQTEQNVTGYTDEQLTKMVEFRNENDFWRSKGAPRPGGLSKKGKDGTRKTVKIYEAYCSQKPTQKRDTTFRHLEPGELPY